MPDPTVFLVAAVLVVLLELSPIVRLPIGLALATAMLAFEAELLPVVLAGALGATLGRAVLAFQARRGRDRLAASSPLARVQREALRVRLASSPAYARTTFLLAALPGVPSRLVFPLLGAMRTPLGPALAGTLLGRMPVLILTTSLFAFLGDVLAPGDDDAAVALGTFAVILLVVRSIGLVDWQHRAATGEWRLRDPDEAVLRMGSMFTGAGPGQQGPVSPFPPGFGPDHPAYVESGPGVVEGEVLGSDEGEDADDEALDGEVEDDPLDSRPSGDASDPRS